MAHRIPTAASDLFPGDLRTEPPRGEGSRSRLNRGVPQRDPASLWDAVEAVLEQRGMVSDTGTVARLTALAWAAGFSQASFVASYATDPIDERLVELRDGV